MTIIIGPRQVGKTYLMRLMHDKLVGEGKKTVWLNLDIEEDASRLNSQAVLISYLKLQVGEEKAYVFIDEIQRKDNADLFLKGIYDMNLPYKFIISGSGSLELKSNIAESMAGRKQMFSVDTLNFTEFVNFKTNYQYEDRLQEFFALEEGKTQRFMEEYMVFGGYPRVILADTIDRKRHPWLIAPGKAGGIYRSCQNYNLTNWQSG